MQSVDLIYEIKNKTSSMSCVFYYYSPEVKGIKLSTTTPPKQKAKPHINNQLMVAKAVIFLSSSFYFTIF